MSNAQDLATPWHRVDTWVFDLDNTLYESSAGVWPQVDARMTVYIMRLFGLDGLSARALQKFFYHRYGTTLRALMDVYDVDPADYLDFCHDIDHGGIAPNPALGAAIAALPGRKLILTNGSRGHAKAVATRLGFFDQFEAVFDIVDAAFVPKPDRRAYDAFLLAHGVEPGRAAMFEDIAANLAVPHALGMRTVLVLPATPDPHRERFEQESVAAPHIGHVTSDLAGFLAGCVLRGSPAGSAAQARTSA